MGDCQSVGVVGWEYGVGADDRVMARAPFTFDVSVWSRFCR